ncbi:MAG: hypothetical protein ACR2JF_15870 [Iamia sp.]
MASDLDGDGFDDLTFWGPGIYRPVVGDLDGNGRDDVIWFGADYRTTIGDYDRDGRDEVIWHAPGSIADRRWDISANRGRASRAFQIYGAYQPVSGDYDGDGRDDLVWSTPKTGAVDFVYGGTTYLR